MTDLPGPDRLAPGAVEAWRQHLGEEVDPESLRRDLSEGTLPQAFHEVAARDPERVALTVGGESIAYGELDRLAARAGGWFQSQGLKPGQRVVLCGATCALAQSPALETLTSISRDSKIGLSVALGEELR